MHIVLVLLALLCVFLYLTIEARKDPDKKLFLSLYITIDILLAAGFLYLIVSAIIE